MKVLRLYKYSNSTYKGEKIKSLAVEGIEVNIITENYSDVFDLGEFLEDYSADYILCELQNLTDVEVNKY